MFRIGPRRSRASTKVGGTLTCPRCTTHKLKFIETVGFDIDLYKCRVCNTPIRYKVTPWDPSSMNPADVKRVGTQNVQQGMHRSELAKMPLLGRFKVRRHKFAK